MQSVRFVLRTVCPRLIRAKKQSVRFVIRTVCPRLINPYDLSTPNQGTPYNLSPYGLSEANQQSVRFVIRTVCLQTSSFTCLSHRLTHTAAWWLISVRNIITALLFLIFLLTHFLILKEAQGRGEENRITGGIYLLCGGWLCQAFILEHIFNI